MSGLRLEDVVVHRGGGSARRMVVDKVSLAVREGKAVGLVGESGCGKSSLARATVGLLPLSSGAVRLNGSDISALRRAGRPSPVQLIFQDSLAALDPQMSVGASIREALGGQRIGERQAVARIEHHLDQVGLDPECRVRRPRELSGGQRQRVAIARALAAEPQVIVADEITSALDVSVQAAVLNLLVRLRQDAGFSLVFISHNLAAVRFVSDEIAVMRRGVLVETGPADEIVTAPKQPYTRALLEAAPQLQATWLHARRREPR
jgi:peptide/nickel transport system ATP-binding protein